MKTILPKTIQASDSFKEMEQLSLYRFLYLSIQLSNKFFIYLFLFCPTIFFLCVYLCLYFFFRVVFATNLLTFLLLFLVSFSFLCFSCSSLFFKILLSHSIFHSKIDIKPKNFTPSSLFFFFFFFFKRTRLYAGDIAKFLAVNGKTLEQWQREFLTAT